jgi:hypothetical protein
MQHQIQNFKVVQLLRIIRDDPHLHFAGIQNSTADKLSEVSYIMYGIHIKLRRSTLSTNVVREKLLVIFRHFVFFSLYNR